MVPCFTLQAKGSSRLTDHHLSSIQNYLMPPDDAKYWQAQVPASQKRWLPLTLMTMVLPQVRADATFQANMVIGTFHGMMAPQTPCSRPKKCGFKCTVSCRPPAANPCAMGLTLSSPRCCPGSMLLYR